MAQDYSNSVFALVDDAALRGVHINQYSRNKPSKAGREGSWLAVLIAALSVESRQALASDSDIGIDENVMQALAENPDGFYKDCVKQGSSLYDLAEIANVEPTGLIFLMTSGQNDQSNQVKNNTLLSWLLSFLMIKDGEHVTEQDIAQIADHAREGIWSWYTPIYNTILRTSRKQLSREDLTAAP